MAKIKKIYAREILDSRGDPTVEVEVELERGVRGSAAVPSGASTGAYEAVEIRDGDSRRYQGKGVLQAVENINKKIQKALKGMDAENQEKIDRTMIELDGQDNKKNLGANAILGVSLAVCRASANKNKLPLYKYIRKKYSFEGKIRIPIPMFNVLNGGKHSDSGLSVQEFKIIPTGLKTFSEQLRAGSEIFHTLKKFLEKNKQKTSVGDEGGFAPNLESNSQALEIINNAIKESEYFLGKQINLGIDAAANSFFDREQDKYILKPENISLEKESLINLYREWIEKYYVISIEDGLQENDWEGWNIMMHKISKKPISKGFGGNTIQELIIIGDDLLVTNVKRLQKAIEEKACNAVLIKVNQIGTLSETIDCIKLAQKNRMKVVVSHRSGETTDDFIADLSVAANADFIKSGSLSRGERICKYNRLLRIEEEI